MNALADLLRQQTELTFFATIGMGYLLGRLRVGGQPIGSVLGVLVVGLLVGQVGIVVSDTVKWIFFDLFLLAIGYRCGPRFINGLRTSGAVQIALTFVFILSAISCGVIVSLVAGFDAGTAAGIFAGSLTASAALGVAGESLRTIISDEGARSIALSNLTTAFAASYFIGVIVTTWFLARVAPAIMRVDLAESCATLEREMGVADESVRTFSAYESFAVRAYGVGEELDGRTIAEIESMFPTGRVFVERVCTDGTVVDPVPDMVLHRTAIVVLSGRITELVGASNPLRSREVADPALLDLRQEMATFTVTGDAFAGAMLSSVARHPATRGIVLVKIERQGQDVAITASTVVERGDRVTVVGRTESIARVAREIGPKERPAVSTNLGLRSLTIVAGGLLGIPTLHAGSLAIGLGVSVGILIGGLVLGWWSSRQRGAGPLPEPILWLFDSLGLTGFVAVTALTAGAGFLASVQSMGMGLVLGSIVVTVLPHLVTVVVGRYVLKVHPGILLGISAGAGTSAPSLAAIQSAAGSQVPTLGYGVAYAIGNIFLALGGSIIVAVMGS
jgi:putative transport protein